MGLGYRLSFKHTRQSDLVGVGLLALLKEAGVLEELTHPGRVHPKAMNLGGDTDPSAGGVMHGQAPGDTSIRREAA